jgi:hypothetical protein
VIDPLAVTRSRLLAIAAVTAIVGSRVYATLLPQDATLPAIALQLIDSVPTSHLRGLATRVSRVQVHSVATKRTDALALANAVEGNGGGSGLSHFQGRVGAAWVHGIFPAGTDREEFHARELNEYEVVRDYLVHLSN